MQELVIIDWRGIIKNLSHSIMSGAIACAYPTEPEEIGHRIMKFLFIQKMEHPNAAFMIANDMRPYWRHKFMTDWYSARGLEPVIYKGNRAKQTWPFATSTSDMEMLYSLLLEQGARSIGATVANDLGLEADDIWGIMSASYKGKVLGISADSDWRQCITADGRVTIYDFTTDTLHTETLDVRHKWIGGDSGDNIPGCTKLKKDGTPAKNGYGKKGAMDLLLTDDPFKGLDPDELERNWNLTTLPPPEWDIEEAYQSLGEIVVDYEATDEYWDRHGITLPVRKHLADKASRNAFMGKLRMHLLTAAREKAEASL
jgi:hypothetical protein